MKQLIFKTLKQQRRYASLLPNGEPKMIRVYDNGESKNPTFDRYTCVYTGNYKKNMGQKGKCFEYVGMSSHPFSPQGFGQHGETQGKPADRPTYGHLGKKIKFSDLSEDCRKLVIQDYLVIWDFVDYESGKPLN